MALLDNSGDIILDAVLTDIGRKRLAEATKSGGTLAKITSFALGDDEINYSLYNLNHPSGSNYSDLEILQTPIMEAFTQANANINYGLLSFNNNQLLYMPALKVNSLYASNFPAHVPLNNVFYVAANEKTKQTLIGDELIDPSYIGLGYSPNAGQYIFVESGLDTTEISKTAENQQTYVAGNSLSNSRYLVGIDNRLSTNVLTLKTGQFENGLTNNSDGRKSFTVGVATQSSVVGSLVNYNYYSSTAKKNNIFEPSTGSPVSDYTTIAGPGDSVTCFQMLVKSSLQTDGTAGGARDVLYTQIGSTNVDGNTLFTGAPTTTNTYDYIDTMVYIVGNTTGGSIGIPVRILRQVS
tara:strand:+ start:31498 stop:32553 length:1056 start_codon:yes stop_codon:yes gene_type:complete